LQKADDHPAGGEGDEWRKRREEKRREEKRRV
jgi:hypothetical protein